jgi:hypothetical protein
MARRDRIFGDLGGDLGGDLRGEVRAMLDSNLTRQNLWWVYATRHSLCQASASLSGANLSGSIIGKPS